MDYDISVGRPLGCTFRMLPGAAGGSGTMEVSVGAEGLLVGGDDRAMQKEEISGWTEQRVALLEKLWGDGLSASRIAETLGGVTRNSVIGKVHRLGLSGRIPWRGRGTTRSRGPLRRVLRGRADAGGAARQPRQHRSRPDRLL